MTSNQVPSVLQAFVGVYNTKSLIELITMLSQQILVHPCCTFSVVSYSMVFSSCDESMTLLSDK